MINLIIQDFPRCKWPHLLVSNPLKSLKMERQAFKNQSQVTNFSISVSQISNQCILEVDQLNL